MGLILSQIADLYCDKFCFKLQTVRLCVEDFAARQRSVINMADYWLKCQTVEKGPYHNSHKRHAY